MLVCVLRLVVIGVEVEELELVEDVEEVLLVEVVRLELVDEDEEVLDEEEVEVDDELVVVEDEDVELEEVDVLEVGLEGKTPRIEDNGSSLSPFPVPPLLF